ncbi:hypothetical protein A3Q56_02217, partial [Intoshia linei]
MDVSFITTASNNKSICELETKTFRNLSLYSKPPREKISLDEFEQLAADRIALLKLFETAFIKHGHIGENYNVWIKKQYTDNLSKSNLKIKLKSDIDVRHDTISHFLLRLHYCQTKESRRWLVRQELELFKYRCSITSKNDLDYFISEINLNYIKITNEDKIEIIQQLSDSLKAPIDVLKNSTIYKIRFEHVNDLVRTRNVFLKKGYAYVPLIFIEKILSQRFRCQLLKALT